MSVIPDHLTNSEILGILGQRVRQQRLERNMGVDELAAHAGLNRKTILSLEAGEDVRFSSVIRILRSMDLLGQLESAIPDRLPGGDAISPTGQLRQRASRKAKTLRHG
jgi:DNA-binding XRE family transcriptional regulator